MILYRYAVPGRETAVCGAGTDAGLLELPGRHGFEAVTGWADLLALPDLAGRVAACLAGGPPCDVAWSELAPGPSRWQPYLLPPLDHQEVWAAGVTYQISRLERMRESETAASVYDQVYGAERPELFLKATPERVAGPGAAIRVRRDSAWTVPEPELAVVCRPDLTVVGYSVGNDVSARDIEGQNPLYLPQAKIYRGSCALGPGLRLSAPEFDPLQQTLGCRIERDGQPLWSDTAEVGRLKRRIPDLVAWLGRELDFPAGVVLLTGTCLVPPETTSLRAGDVVTCELSGIGALRNPVEA